MNEEKITQLTKETKLATLFEQYPGLKDYLVNKSEKFSALNSPIASMMIKKANIGMVVQRTGLGLEKLQAYFTSFLEGLK